MNMSPDGRARMRHTEKVALKYYDDGGAGKGHCTWGAGLLAHRGPCSKEELARKVTLVEVEAEFARRLHAAEGAVERNIKVPLTQSQFDALVSYVYNNGSTGSIPLYEKVNAKDFAGAADVISRSVRSRQKNKQGKAVYVLQPGLIARRAEESVPFRNAANVQIAGDAK
jgi:GH24 family phage-related lysozyme (muramidase)